MRAAIIITTKNRKDELRSSLKSVANQSFSLETVVVDDGSTDDTSEMVNTEFPNVRVIRHKESRGLIVRRNEAASMVTASVIFSLDDDASFSSPYVVEQTLNEFDHPRVGAVAIPCIDINEGQDLRQPMPEGRGIFVTDAFIGTAHAVRRDVFLQTGGYRAELVHQGEERDFCLRMLNAGWIVRSGCADPIHHFESPNRDFGRRDFYGRRNDILFAWQNVPTPYLLRHFMGTIANGFRSGFQSGHLQRMLRGMISGCSELVRGKYERAPVSREIYQLHRRLRKRGPEPLESVEPELPRLTVESSDPALLTPAL